MKKAIFLTLAGAMIFSTPVMAKEVGAPVAVYLEDESDIGIPEETVLAIEEDKVISEHMNNAVIDVWDMDGEMVQLYIRGGIKSSHSYYFWDNLRASCSAADKLPFRIALPIAPVLKPESTIKPSAISGVIQSRSTSPLSLY